MTNKKTTTAFNEALALESIPESLQNCNPGDLTRYARTVAYKVFHNLKEGYTMNSEEDPLLVDAKPANIVWKHHYTTNESLDGEK